MIYLYVSGKSATENIQSIRATEDLTEPYYPILSPKAKLGLT